MEYKAIESILVDGDSLKDKVILIGRGNCPAGWELGGILSRCRAVVVFLSEEKDMEHMNCEAQKLCLEGGNVICMPVVFSDADALNTLFSEISTLFGGIDAYIGFVSDDSQAPFADAGIDGLDQAYRLWIKETYMVARLLINDEVHKANDCVLINVLNGFVSHEEHKEAQAKGKNEWGKFIFKPALCNMMQSFVQDRSHIRVIPLLYETSADMLPYDAALGLTWAASNAANHSSHVLHAQEILDMLMQDKSERIIGATLKDEAESDSDSAVDQTASRVTDCANIISDTLRINELLGILADDFDRVSVIRRPFVRNAFGKFTGTTPQELNDKLLTMCELFESFKEMLNDSGDAGISALEIKIAHSYPQVAAMISGLSAYCVNSLEQKSFSGFSTGEEGMKELADISASLTQKLKAFK